MIEILDKIRHTVKCNHCDSILRYVDSDLTTIENEQGFYCPCCDNWMVVNKLSPFRFPESFRHFSTSTGAVDIDNSRVQEFVDECVRSLKESEETYDYACVGTGNTIVIATKDEDEIACYVAKDYYKANEFDV